MSKKNEDKMHNKQLELLKRLGADEQEKTKPKPSIKVQSESKPKKETIKPEPKKADASPILGKSKPPLPNPHKNRDPLPPPDPKKPNVTEPDVNNNWFWCILTLDFVGLLACGFYYLIHILLKDQFVALSFIYQYLIIGVAVLLTLFVPIFIVKRLKRWEDNK